MGKPTREILENHTAKQAELQRHQSPDDRLSMPLDATRCENSLSEQVLAQLTRYGIGDTGACQSPDHPTDLFQGQTQETSLKDGV
jgi:hypothetical protein